MPSGNWSCLDAEDIWKETKDNPICSKDFFACKERSAKERACINSGVTVNTTSCCESVSDFPNYCLGVACDCSPENSHQVKVCDCGSDKCFDGEKCVGRIATGQETTDWKTYRNDELGIEFQYPKIYDEDEKYKLCRVSVSNESISIADRIWINIFDSQGLSLKDYVDKQIKNFNLQVKEETLTENKIGLSYRLPGSMAYGTTVYKKNSLRDENKIYQVVLERPNDLCDFDNISVFDVLDHLLSTFRFLE
jgi:hypothetical protein